MFNPKAEVVTDFRDVHNRAEYRADREDVLRLLRRRPCTAHDIAQGLGMHHNEVSKHLEELTSLKQAKGSWCGRSVFLQVMNKVHYFGLRIHALFMYRNPK